MLDAGQLAPDGLDGASTPRGELRSGIGVLRQQEKRLFVRAVVLLRELARYAQALNEADGSFRSQPPFFLYRLLGGSMNLPRRS